MKWGEDKLVNEQVNGASGLVEGAEEVGKWAVGLERRLTGLSIEKSDAELVV